MKPSLAVAAAVLATLAACSREAPPRAPIPPPPPVAAPAPEPAAVPAQGPLPPPATISGERLTPGRAATYGKVGDAKCRMCHKLQHDSWSASPHARKGLDCEGCHGGGADFTKVMRDRTAAIAAGLVLPKKEFCQGCHKKDWQDAMLMRVHAHKVK
jgi:hypothetical protein